MVKLNPCKLDTNTHIDFKMPKFVEVGISKGYFSEIPEYIQGEFNYSQNWRYEEIDGKGCFEFDIVYNKLSEIYYELVTFIKKVSNLICDIWGVCLYPEIFDMECSLDNQKYTLIIDDKVFFLYPPRLLMDDFFETGVNDLYRPKSYINYVNELNDIINYRKLTCRFFIIDSYNIKK